MKSTDDIGTTVIRGDVGRKGQARNLFDDVAPKNIGKPVTDGDSFRRATVFYEKEGISSQNQPDVANVTQLATPASSRDASEVQDFMDDPVVGWVVVIRGAGKGKSLPLGYGINALGRAASQRVCLDFGDKQISRENHALITYEPIDRVFYLQNGGGGVNLTYLQKTLDEELSPVLTPRELENGHCIQLGTTTLKFIALCGNQFDWNGFA